MVDAPAEDDAGSSRRETVPEALAGERLDRLVSMIADVSRSEAADVVASGAVRIDGQVCDRGASRVRGGAALEIALPAPPSAGVVADAGVRFDVVHEDPDMIVIDKPAGLVVHPGAGMSDGTLANGLLARFPDLAGVGDPVRPGIVHRLDRGTSGLMVVARTPQAYAALVEQMSARTVQRRYLALVWGAPGTARGVVDAPIGRSQRVPTRMAVSTRGRDARTRYEVLERFTHPAEVSLLECVLDTGRTHQIRVHLAAIGHPVLGDDRYNGVRQSLDCARPFLHAAELGFVHPASGETVHFSSPLPKDLEPVLVLLRGDSA